MRKLILIGVLICAFIYLAPFMASDANGQTSSVQKGRFSASLKDVCNKVMMAIYNDILSSKSEDDNLVNFGQQVLSMNQYGIYSIEYKHEITEGMREGEFLSFGVTIVKPNDTNFNEYGQQAFNFAFPLLDLKFAGYQKTNRKFMKFHIQDVVQRNGDLLLREQQKLLPLRLTLKADKDVFKVGENIGFTVTLENVSNKNLWIRDLDKDTLYFLYDNTRWGALEIGAKKGNKERKYILKPGEKVRKRFVGGGSSFSDEIEIYCSYALTFKGVKPYATLNVKIEE